MSINVTSSKFLWPNYPKCLSEVLLDEDRDLLTLLQAGLQEQLNLPTRIVEFIDSKPNMIDATNKLLKYRRFCLTARKFGLCELESIKTAKDYIENDYSDAKPYECYLGLTRFCYGIRVCGKLVAVCIAGKFRVAGSTENIKSLIYASTHSSLQKKELISVINTLPELDDRELQNMLKNFRNAVDIIGHMTNHCFNIRKETSESSFLKKQGSLVSKYPAPKNSAELKKRVKEVLDKIRHYIGTKYVAIFSAREASDIDLSLTAQSGFSEDVDGNVHFNWKKAGLPDHGSLDANDEAQIPERSVLIEGIRGLKAPLLSDSVFLQPYQFADGHRGIMIIGPFLREVNIDDEKSFLHRTCHLIGWRTLGMVVLRSLEDRDKQRDSNIQLAAHGIRSGLHAILSETDEIDQRTMLLLRTAEDEARIKQAIDTISRQVDALSQQTTIIMRSPKETLNDIHRTELQIERTSLAVLLQNCIQKFRGAALSKKNVSIKVEPFIDLLPEVKVDVILLDLAFSNLLDNAVKYSFTDTEIRIWAENLNGVVQIYIQNYGYPIKDKEIARIFDKGYRSTYKRNEQSIIGVGLGLHQSRKLIELHKGRIGASCGHINPKDGGALALFTVALPIDS